MGRVRMQIIHMIAGVFIAGLLGAHMVRLHLTRMVGLEEDPVGWTAMIGRSTDVAWVGVYIALLAFALYHALFGLRGVILESTSSAKWERTINWLFIIIGTVVFGWGTYVPLALLNG